MEITHAEKRSKMLAFETAVFGTLPSLLAGKIGSTSSF